MKATSVFGSIFIGAVLTLLVTQSSAEISSGSSDYPFKPVPFTAVHLDDVFWGAAAGNESRDDDPLCVPEMQGIRTDVQF